MAPTQYLDTFGVHGVSTSVLGDNAFDGNLQITHDIGANVNSGVELALYDPGCVTEQALSGTAVSLTASDFIADNFTYTVTIDDSLVGNVSNTFVEYKDDNDSIVGESEGAIVFCTRISTFAEDFFVGYYQFDFRIRFNLTQNEFDFTDIAISEVDEQVIETSVNDNFGVGACLCDDDFDCYVNPPSVNANAQALDFCLFPTISDIETSVVEISNFNALMTGGEGGVESTTLVSYGDGVWEENDFATVSVVGQTVRVSAIVPEEYFTATELNVTGTVFLEFARMAEFESFNFVVKLEDVELEKVDYFGCFAKMLIGFFR